MATFWRGLIMVLFLTGSADKLEWIQPASGSRNDALELYAGGVVARQGAAGSAFGTVRAGKGKRQFSYFVVFKHRLSAERDIKSEEEVMLDDAEGESKQTVRCDGKTLQMDCKIKLDPGTKKVSRETLTINGKSVDVAKGRVFLVDLTATPPTWEQRGLTLPVEVVEATSKKAAEGLVKKVLASLAKQDRTTRVFIDAAGK